MKVGRIIGTAILAMLFLLFVAIDLVVFGVFRLNSPLVTVLPLGGLVLGGVLGGWAGSRAGTMPPAEMVVTTPPTWMPTTPPTAAMPPEPAPVEVPPMPAPTPFPMRPPAAPPPDFGPPSSR